MEQGHISFPTDDATPKTITLKSKDAWESERITGLHFTPTAAMSKEFKYRKTESLHLSRNIFRGAFDGHDANMIYHSRWQSRLSFFLPMTTFSHTQCCRLQIPIYAALLPKFGGNCHLPLEIRHGPRSHGGSGFIHIYTEQGLKHLQQTLRILCQTTTLSTQLKITLSNNQQHIGTSTLFLNFPMNCFKYRIKGRIAYLWSFCNKNNISFDISEIWKPAPLQINDYNLMEFFTAIPNIAELSITQVQACRLYLQVSNLSDLTTPDGMYLNQAMITPPCNYKPANSLHWPFQPHPGNFSWERWKNMLLYYFCHNNSLHLKKAIYTAPPISHLQITENHIPTIISKLPLNQ